jgi:hypothetical protein
MLIGSLRPDSTPPDEYELLLHSEFLAVMEIYHVAVGYQTIEGKTTIG